jgi:hypothetical protein
MDTYTKEILIEQYKIHKEYVTKRIESSNRLNIKFRFPSIPEDITENIIKFILHNISDTTVTWNCKGDLLSKIAGVFECKCFTSIGPLSFTPSSNWDNIYFLDAQEWLKNRFTLYEVSLKRNSKEWNSIMINKTETFEDQCKQKRRPRICWKLLHPQLKDYCKKIFEGTFEDIFTPKVEQVDLQSIEQLEEKLHSLQVYTDDSLPKLEEHNLEEILEN